MARTQISIIIAVYNGEKYLQKCFNSIANQTNKDWEIIVIDGASSDNTVEIIKKNKDLIAYWESKLDDGIYHAWNKALKHVKGEWICFMGADDFFYAPNVLEDLLRNADLAKKSEMMIVYGKTALIEQETEKVLAITGETWNRAKFRQVMTFVTSGTLHHNSLFLKHGKYREEYKIAGDYEFLLRELKSNDAFFVPDLIIVGMIMGGVSTNIDYRLKLVKEVYNARRDNSINEFSLKLFLWKIKVILLAISMKLLGQKISMRLKNSLGN